MDHLEADKRTRHAPPGVHVGRFEASDVGPVIVFTFHGFAGCTHGNGVVELIPAFSGVFTRAAVADLREVCDQILKAKQTMKADVSFPQ